MRHESVMWTLLGAAVLAITGCHATTPTGDEGAAGAAEQKVPHWRDLRFGMFVHWGLYSELGGVWDGEPVKIGYSEQIQAWAKISHADYAKVAAAFNPTRFDPDAICKLAKDAGMKYIVITTKHHDGFCMFDSKLTEYDIVDATRYKKDALKELADACRRHGLGFGVYYSLIDWKAGHEFEPNRNSNPIPASIEDYTVGQLEELMTSYGPIVEVWFDMSNPTKAQSKRFADAVRRHQPDAMINGRVWNDEGDFLVMGDNRVPNVRFDQPWQTPASVYDATWGYRSWQEREDLEGKVKAKTRALIKVTALGGNYLLNIGPRGDGSIVEFEARVLRGVGRWLKANRNGESIYTAGPQPFQKLDFGWCTARPGKLYLHVFDHPDDGKLVVPGLVSKVNKAYRLSDANSKALAVQRSGDDVVIDLGGGATDPIATVVCVDYAGDLDIIPHRLARPGAGSATVLTPQLATHTRRVTGGSYFELKRVTVAMRWDFEVKAGGTYVVEVAWKPAKTSRQLELVFDDNRARMDIVTSDKAGMAQALVRFADGQRHRCGLRVAEPDSAYDDLGVEAPSIRIVPVKD